MEEVAVYGYITPLKVKIILALTLSDAIVRDLDVIAVCFRLRISWFPRSPLSVALNSDPMKWRTRYSKLSTLPTTNLYPIPSSNFIHPSMRQMTMRRYCTPEARSGSLSGGASMMLLELWPKLPIECMLSSITFFVSISRTRHVCVSIIVGEGS